MNMAAAIAIAAIATLTPTITCIIAYLLSRQDVRRIEDKLKAFKQQTNSRFVAMRDEMSARFEAVIARFEAVNEKFDEVKESSHKDAWSF